MRLIDADALLDTLDCSDRDLWTKYTIDEAPTIDAVPVVRCRDCRHRSDEMSNGCWFCNHKMLGLIRPDDFCSYGEKRGDDAI